MDIATGLRTRLLEPAVGGVTGGTRVVVHGTGFRPLPHSLLVRFGLAETGTRIDVPATYLLETQLECVVPSFKDDVRSVLSRRTTLTPTSSTLALAPHLVPVQVEVIMDADYISNALVFLLHQDIAITKITPQFVLLMPPTTVTVTTNLLKLSASSRPYPQNAMKTTTTTRSPPELVEISSLPVFVRVRQVSERKGVVSERTVAARWRISSVGIYEVEFDAVMLTFGDATVELTLNRHDFFRAKDKTPDAVGYCVHRDVTLASIDPCCLSVTSGRSTEVRLLGEGFVDSGDLTVQLLQRDIQEAALNASAAGIGELHSLTQLSATYQSPNEIRCSVPPNMSFGLTHFQVSLNGGRQYGRDRAVALLYRDRAVKGIEPSVASLDGTTSIKLRLEQLTINTVDGPQQLQHLIPPRRIRVKFEAIGDESDGAESSFPLVKVVPADISKYFPPQHERFSASNSESEAHSIVCCRVPSFLEEVKLLKEKHAKTKSEDEVVGEFALVRRFRISLSLGGDVYFGSIPFGAHFPPVIQSMTRHHGPRSGGTIIFLRMKYRVPSELAIQVRFLHIATRQCEFVRGVVGTEYYAQHGARNSSASANSGSPSRAGHERHENPAFLVVCTSPFWNAVDDAPSLTKVQVSFDGGFNFVPVEEEHELIAAGLASPRSKGIPSQHVKDMSYLYFLFYPVPKLLSVVPMSADIQGGSFITIRGEHIVDHGGRISVVFQSPAHSRKVVGIIDREELRCCVPPFGVGPVTIFVSLNGEQYTKCAFLDPDSKEPIDFVYYSSPLPQRLSPLSTSISHSSEIRIFGLNLIETGRVKVRFGFANQSGKLVFKDVPGRAEDGVIVAHSPLFAADYGNLKAVVDVALNGNDFSGKLLSLYYYASYTIQRIEPPVGAIDISIPVTLFLSQNLISDELLVRVRFKLLCLPDEQIFGPVPVARWETNRIDFVLPAVCEFTRSVHDLESATVDISFDKAYFHPIGDLLKYYRPYKLPPVFNISPLVGQFEQGTTVVARCSELQEGQIVTMTMAVELFKQAPSVAVMVVAETNLKRQTLTWQCPPLSKFVKMDLKNVTDDDKRMILPARLTLQISTVHGQLLTLPFHFQYYRMPVLLSMNPRVGYICGGSVISFEFKEPIETPTIDFRFGSNLITSGRVRDENKRLVECLSPVLLAGIHTMSLSFDEQYFEDVYVKVREAHTKADGEDKCTLDDRLASVGVSEDAQIGSHAEGKNDKKFKCTFQAFVMPHFTIPMNTHRVYGFGPVDGGSYVVIKGRGFIVDGKMFVRFSSPHGDTLVSSGGAQKSEVTVKASVLDDTTVLCTSPPATQPGRVTLEVTYNLQQYTDSSCFFEYHDPTRFTSRGILCGPVSGGAPVCIQVENSAGIPEDKTLLQSNCALRFVSEKTGYSVVVDACFDDESLHIQCITPSWPSNELVAVEVALSNHTNGAPTSRQFFSTGVRFLFYDPPEGLITIEPSAGPITGGTEVLARCGKLVDTGEIMVSVTITDQEDKEEQLKELTSVGEDDDGNEDVDSAVDMENSPTNKEVVYLVKGKIVGEAVSFIAPAVLKPGFAYLNIALNGINYTSTQESTLRYTYYCDPVIHRISPLWSTMESACLITIHGEYIQDHGCKAVIQFQQQHQQQQWKDAHAECILVDGSFMDSRTEPKSSRALQCCFQAPQPGFYEIQISLNGGQQFTTCRFMAAMFGNYSGSACAALLPFRSFSSPCFLATPTGSVAGGSAVILFMNKKLSKLLARETRCHVQFAPVKNSDAITSSTQRSAAPDGVVVVGEIDHHESKITCRAPLLRAPCVAALDVLLPLSLTSGSEVSGAVAATKTLTASTGTALTSCSTLFGVRERERFHAYESPTITEVAPSCGPLSGDTCVVIECSNIVETGQIFVRFRSVANERECVLVPAVFARTFPDGSVSASPLLICRTPQVEVTDRMVIVSEAASSSTSSTLSPGRGSGSRDGSTTATTSKVRAHTFQQMAETSLRNGHNNNILRVTRTVLKNTLVSSISAAVSVLVDFTMNAGEQFIAHSVPFQFYPVLEPSEIRWFPRHLPTQSFDRAATGDARTVTIQFPKTLRTFCDSASAAERVSLYFEGAPQQLFSPSQKRRGSSVVLRDTGNGRGLAILDAKLQKESATRRPSTGLRNSTLSAAANSLLDNSSACLGANSTHPRPVVVKGVGPHRPSAVLGSAGPGPSLAGATSDMTTSSSQYTPPYIAAKIVKGGLEVTCPVPEFGGCGAVQVFFSFNAQQFICLGELHVHEPLVIREERQQHFTANVVGDRFTLFCSLSSVFDFLAPSNVLNETEVLERQRQDAGIVKPSQALPGLRRDSEPAVTDQSLVVRDLKHENENGWHNRQFHDLQLHLVPPNPLVIRKLVVSARRPGTRAEVATSSPDEFGCCVFETTEWSTDMLVAATPPVGLGYSSFSRVLSMTKNSDNEAHSVSGKTHAVMVQLPTAPNEAVAYCFGVPGLNLKAEVVGADGTPVKESTTRSSTGQYSLTSFDAASATGLYVCVDMRECGDIESYEELHVVVGDAVDVQVYLTGSRSAGYAGVWVVAYVSSQPSGGFTVVEIDCRVDTFEDLATSESLTHIRTLAIAAAGEIHSGRAHALVVAKPTTVTACVHFACADSSLNLSASAVAQLILPGDHTLTSYYKRNTEPSTTSEVVLHCDMPALPFNGPTILTVRVDGVTFSNLVCVHCYDPRMWRIARIDPPCGLVKQILKMRITGDHFVDNQKTIVRFSDATRYQNFPVTMERYHLLIVRVATVRNLRSLLPPQYVAAVTPGGLSPHKAHQQSNRDEVTPFTVVARVEYRDQVFQATSRESAVQASLAPSANAPPLGWEDQFELQIPADAMATARLLVIIDLIELSGNRTAWELGRAVVPTNGIQEAALSKRTYSLEEHFRWRNCMSSTPQTSDVEVFLHLSPLMTQPDVVVCDVSPFVVAQCLCVQISSGDSFFSPCPGINHGEHDESLHPFGNVVTTKPYRPLFQTYELPVVTDTLPCVLPRTTGGEIVITGKGFIDCGQSRRIWVRLFACSESPPTDQGLLEQINATQETSQPTPAPFFIRDVRATFISSTSLKVMIPPRLASYNIYYRVSVDDGVNFSVATHHSHVMMYSANTVDPKGGPVSGNTYVAAHGSNFHACIALGNLAPVVKLTWMRGAKELESIVVRGEVYPLEEVVYFYTPQSKFGLQNITVHVEIALVRGSDLPPLAAAVSLSTVLSNITAVFGHDEIPFVVYRTPTIKAIVPLHSLVCGLSSLELIVQGLDEKAAALLKCSIKARFKRRGQMQLADVHLSSGNGGFSDGKLVTIVPRFVVGSATATDVIPTVVSGPSLSRQWSQLGTRASDPPVKVWTRHGAVYVILLRARNLFVAKKTATCNPFVVIHCDKAQLKSTRKDGTSSPVWNEIFDFDWRSEIELPRAIRVSVENQLSSNQSELLGQVSIQFAEPRDISKPFCVRNWFPLRRASARGASSFDSNGKPMELGEVEVAIAFIPAPPKKAPPRLLQAGALKTSIMSAMQQQKQTAATAHQQHETPRGRKERLLRAFRRQGAPPSLVPSELIVELAVNGQDFWSSAPSRCLTVSTPIVVATEPSFICRSGGTLLSITGLNFVQCRMLRVAFAVVSTDAPVVLRSQNIVMVDARYRSSHCITCVTPPLQSLGATEASVVNVYVTSNGLDFDSVALPLTNGESISADNSMAKDTDVVTDRDVTSSSSKSVIIQSVREKYVIHNRALAAKVMEPTVIASQSLLHQLRVYRRPIVHRVRPADGVYTSLLVIEGCDFSNTGIAIARFCSKNDAHDVRTARVNVVSDEQMECATPDFPRGTVVTMSIAVNGVEFVPCAGEFEVFQSPRLTEIVPTWIFVATDVKQDVRILGVNLTTNSSASGSVQVSFQRGDLKKVVKGQCVDGEVLCSVPLELMVARLHSLGTSEALASILVDVWLGGNHKTFTERPLALHLYSNIPAVAVVAPTNGPIYGGYPVTIEGSGFINTGKIVVRFLLLQDALPSAETNHSSAAIVKGKGMARQLLLSPATFVDVGARFVSTEALTCTAPSFPQEGVYSVTIALNGVEFHTDAAQLNQAATWFLAWQNWQRRKQLIVHRESLAMAVSVKIPEPVPPSPVKTSASVPIVPESPLPVQPLSGSQPLSGPQSTTGDTAFGRRMTSRTALRSPHPSDDSHSQEFVSVGDVDSPRRRREQLRKALDKMIEDESCERVEDHLVDVQLLQWHPATADGRNRSLTALLSELFTAPETQQLMIRRIGYVFRMRGARDVSTGQRVFGTLSSFAHALKLIFPHAPEREFEELWKMVDPAQLGFVSLQSLTKRFIVTDTLRPRSPEPGPTHYNPNYALVETKPLAPVILRESTMPTEGAGLPSELFMNYDAFKAVRPRVKGGAFLKREFLASWCNPVSKEKMFQVETDEELERTFLEVQQAQQTKRSTRDTLISLATSPQHATPRRPQFRTASLIGNRLKGKPPLAQTTESSEPDRTEVDTASSSGVSRGERLAQAAATHDNSVNKLTSPRGASAAMSAAPGGNGSSGRYASGRSRSILHDDIAPLYLKFLRSKEVQKGNTTTND